ncbi:MAG: dihydroorotase, partial [Syntrophales bacterium]|nr:dihydroorotase [Syntrophales bacterium]
MTTKTRETERLILKGPRVVDPSQQLDAVADIYIVNGRIEKIVPPGEGTGEGRIWDLTGMIATPGLLDMHVHLRDPGWEYKETIVTGSEAACAGGFTAVACMANTHPVNDNRSVTEYICRRAAECGLVHVYPIGAITLKQEGENLTEFWDLKEAGVVAFSDDGKPVRNAGLLRHALEYAHSMGSLIISHCEDLDLSLGGLMNESFVSTKLGLPGIPSIAEEIIVARDIALAEYTGAAIHIAHVSTAGSVRLIREAKLRGVKVTAETAPHYFTLTDEALQGFDTNFKVNPPLRSPRDVAAIKEGLQDGSIDV